MGRRAFRRRIGYERVGAHGTADCDLRRRTRRGVDFRRSCHRLYAQLDFRGAAPPPFFGCRGRRDHHSAIPFQPLSRKLQSASGDLRTGLPGRVHRLYRREHQGVRNSVPQGNRHGCDAGDVDRHGHHCRLHLLRRIFRGLLDRLLPGAADSRRNAACSAVRGVRA